MSAKQKYRYAIVGVFLLFVYIAGTEVIERFSVTSGSFRELLAKESRLMTPEELVQRKAGLQMRKALLARQMNAGDKAFDRNQLGVVRFLNESADASKLRFKSLTPLEDVTTNQIRVTSFNVQFNASYHQVGKFVCTLEMSFLPIEVRKLTLEATKPGSALLKVGLEGKARFLPNEGFQP